MSRVLRYNGVVLRIPAPLYNVSALRRLLTVLTLAALAVLPLAARPLEQAAEASPCDLTAPDRIVAVGDVHGAFDAFTAILREARLIDNNRRWIGGTATLVQMGDVLDRGPDSKRVLDLLRALEGEAARAGGQVHALVGNHEVMRLIGDQRYISAKEYAAFMSPDSRDLRDKLYESAVSTQRANARKAGEKFDEGAYRKLFYDETPLGLVEMHRAFGPDGEYGKWMRARRVLVRINGIVFVHGGIGTEFAAAGCVALTTRARLELQAAGLGGEGIDLLGRQSGPVWHRGLVDGTASAADVEAVLTGLGAKAIVVGHTVTNDNKIQVRFDGRVFAIDTGMLGGEFYPNGVPSALELKDGAATAIYIGRREPLK
jgi:hypothetical protein